MKAAEMNNQAEDAIRRARALNNSLGHTNISEIWEDLQRSHKLARLQDNEFPEYPYWVEERVPGENIKLMLSVIYGSGAYMLKSWAPVVYITFGVEEWKVVLFLATCTNAYWKRWTSLSIVRETI
jgi:hypothetical protein